MILKFVVVNVGGELSRPAGRSSSLNTYHYGILKGELDQSFVFIALVPPQYSIPVSNKDPTKKEEKRDIGSETVISRFSPYG